jgi:hypothetical protein
VLQNLLTKHFLKGAEPVTTLELNSHSLLNVVEKEIKLTRLANADLSDEESDEEEM